MRGVCERRGSIRISNGACCSMCTYNASETQTVLLDRVRYKYCLRIPQVLCCNVSASIAHRVLTFTLLKNMQMIGF